MSDAANAIMDAAEVRIRKGGFNGFSFREVATDVGIKSSSVHYHFPTKGKLAEAVIRRYTDDVSDHIDEMFLADRDPVRVWTTAIGSTLRTAQRMCPCTVMGATALDIPQEVAAAVKDFFQMMRNKMVEQGMDAGSADLLMATLIGAQVVSNAMGDADNFDRVVAEQMRVRGLNAPVKQPVAA
jgi:TetR/AcrR family transcriptional regulator, transcriptional repressor for nem operon